LWYADVDPMLHTIWVVCGHASVTQLGCEDNVRCGGYCTNERNYLEIHDTIRNQQTVDRRAFFENVFRGLSTLLLRLDGPSDEPSDHIEFSPVDPRRMNIVIIRVAFVSADQVEQMDLTEFHT